MAADHARLEAQELADAFEEVRHCVAHACRYHDDWFDAELRPAVLEAYEEVEPLWDRFLAWFGKPRGDGPPRKLTSNDLRALRGAGLLGRQGQLKSRGIRNAAKAFLRSPKRRLFKAATDWGGVALGSAAGIVPGGEAISEFVSVVSKAIPDR
jgi:hypothetical protein